MRDQVEGSHALAALAFGEDWGRGRGDASLRRARARRRPGARGRYTLRVGCQSPHGLRAVLAHTLAIDPARRRMVTE